VTAEDASIAATKQVAKELLTVCFGISIRSYSSFH
jgi:hypothetical protein